MKVRDLNYPHPAGKAAVYWLSGREWAGVILFSLAASLAVHFFLLSVTSWWWAVGFFFSILAFCHFAISLPRDFVFPMVLPIFFAVQHVVAAAYIAEHPEYGIKWQRPTPEEYAQLAALSLACLYAGLLLPMTSMSRRSVLELGSVQASAASTKVFAATIWFGIAVRVVSGTGLANSLGIAFIVYLLGRISYVGIVGLWITRSPSAAGYTILLGIVEFLHAIRTTLFHDLVYYGILALCLLCWEPRKYKFLTRWRFAVLIAGILAILVLQSVKQVYRSKSWQMGTMARMGSLVRLVVDSVLAPKDVFSEKTLGTVSDRFDHSQIVLLVMETVPRYEPYAHGETIYMAVRSSLSLRMIEQGKFLAGGGLLERFTRYRRPDNTAINLGILAEMYANFGFYGAIVACGCYGLVVGLLWRLAAVLAKKETLWWAWAVFVGLRLIKVEDATGEQLNYFIKAAVIAAAVIYAVPFWRRTLVNSPRMLRPAGARYGA